MSILQMSMINVEATREREWAVQGTLEQWPSFQSKNIWTRSIISYWSLDGIPISQVCSPIKPWFTLQWLKWNLTIGKGNTNTSIRGSTMHQKRSPVISDIIDIPPELIKAQREADLCFDTIQIWSDQEDAFLGSHLQMNQRLHNWVAPWNLAGLSWRILLEPIQV